MENDVELRYWKTGNDLKRAFIFWDHANVFHNLQELKVRIDKWINATIAAELAIKEFLSNEKFGLNLEPLLMEIPSPPISKLYGKILKSYAKEQSPKRKSIIKGEEKRNHLIHRPSIVKISQEEAIKYVRDVEIAIYHLLNLLFPDDVLISYIYERV